MKTARSVSDYRRRKSLKLGLLLLSTLFIIGASALVYSSVSYERALNVEDTTGSGSTASVEASFTPAAIMMLAVAALIISVSIFGFLRQAKRHLGPHEQMASPIIQEEEWEESPQKEESEK